MNDHMSLRREILSKPTVSQVFTCFASFGPMSMEELVERIDLLDHRPEKPTPQQVRAAVNDLLGLGLAYHRVDRQFELRPIRTVPLH